MRRSHRSTILGIGLMAGAGALALLAVVATGSPPRPPTSVERTVAHEVPPTIPTVAPTTKPAEIRQRRPPVTSTRSSPQASVATLPTSPIAAQLPDRVSAVPRVEAARAPVLLGVPDIGVMVPVRDVGVQPNGELEIPDETEVGWYRLGSSPGRAGATVLAGHVSWNDTTGPFFRLADLQPGAEIQLNLADGTSRRYSVTERAQYPKQALPQDRIWTRAGDETLVLITCGGGFNRAIRRYTDNVVVYAVPVASTP